MDDTQCVFVDSSSVISSLHPTLSLCVTHLNRSLTFASSSSVFTSLHPVLASLFINGLWI